MVAAIAAGVMRPTPRSRRRQSSANRTTSGDGHPAGAAKLLTSPVCVSASLAGVHPTAALSLADATVVAGCTTSVTLTARIDVLERATVTSPV